MKKWHLILIAIACMFVIVITSVGVIPVLVYGGAVLLDGMDFVTKADIEIDSYRLCQDADGKDVVIVKYLLKNEGSEPTSLFNESEICVYQNGVQLTECYDELPNECDYDLEDQMKYIKGGKTYDAEIAYFLENTDDDVEVEVLDYGLFDGKKHKIFTIQQTNVAT